ncbi:MAG: ABC transporter substrate-binding protein, partial [Chloroflexi bacterium]|nr:ABC transporter substrate-binding protein [Chloroflexota bacterium]
LSPPGDAAAGQLIVRGAELGAEYVNMRMGGIIAPSCALPGPIELVRADDRGTPEQGIAGFRKLAQDDRVAGVVGQFHSSVSLAIQPIADQLQVPWISTQSSSADITKNRKAYTFQTHVITTDRSLAVTDFIKANNFRKVAIVAENTDYGTGNAESLKQAMAGASGVELRDWIFDRTTPDISPLLLQVKSFGPDLIYNVGVGAPVYTMIKQAYDTGLMPQIAMLVSYDLPIRPEFWQNTGDQGRGMLFVAYSHPRQQLSDAGRWMQSEYERRFNEPALYSTLAAFGNVLQMAQAINQACSIEGPSLVRVLETGSFTTWNQSGVNFPPAEGEDYHRVKQPLLMVQYTESNQEFGQATIVYPPNLKTGDVRR